MSNLRTKTLEKQKMAEQSLLSAMTQEYGTLNQQLKELTSRCNQIKAELKAKGLELGEDRFEGEDYIVTLTPREDWNIHPKVWYKWLKKNGHEDLFFDSIKVSTEFVSKGFGDIVKALVGERKPDVIALTVKEKG